MTSFRLPTRVTVHPGCSSELPRVVGDLGLDSVLLVSDPGLAETGHPTRIRDRLIEAGVRVSLFQGVEPNPRTTTAEAAAEAARSAGAAGVVGLGGGSALDTAKAAAMLATNPSPAESFAGRNLFRSRPLPYLALPTTCGTGSEVTWVAVLSHLPSRRKVSIKGERMFPARALVDAALLTTLPGPLVASTALDAMTHALEATTSRLANPVSDALAEKAIELLFRYLERAVSDIAGDAEAREAVMRASTLAGIAFGNADVGAVHCLSETIGGLWDVPHGMANAILLAPVLRSHRPHVDRRLAELGRQSFPEDSGASESDAAERFLDELEGLVHRVGIPTFKSLAIPAEELRSVAAGATENNSNGSNPRRMGEPEYLKILEGLAA